MEDAAHVITQTRNWIREIVIGCNFCPFASREVHRNSIHYQVEPATVLSSSRQLFLQELKRLDRDKSIETTLIIFPNTFTTFAEYLALVKHVERILQQKGYAGVYQVASFHPQYQFGGSAPEDASNYTNRSIYPMLHILREASIRKALSFYPHAEKIPARNVSFAREKGAEYMKMLRDSCL